MSGKTQDVGCKNVRRKDVCPGTIKQLTAGCPPAVQWGETKAIKSRPRNRYAVQQAGAAGEEQK